MLDRRNVLAAIAALAATGVRGAAAAEPAVARGALAHNAIARAFESAPPDLPDVTLLGLSGSRGIAALKGRTVIMPLWAEWCAPCLAEMPDFARLQRRYGSAKFAIVPVLTGTRRQMEPRGIAELFGRLHANVFEPLTEANFGARLERAMAGHGSNRMTLPCTLLLAPDGRVAGRVFGMLRDGDDNARPASHEENRAMIARAAGGDSVSLWGKAAGDEFASAMANGFLG